MLVILCLAGVIAVSTAIFIHQIKSSMDKMMIPDTRTDPVLDVDQPLPEEGPHLPAEANADDLYILVMGLDYREAHHSLLTDSLMVLRMLPQESMVKLLSIPRDLLVENAIGNTVKINSLFYEGYVDFRQKAANHPAILTGDTVQLGSITVDKAVLSGAMANTRDKIEEVLDIDIDHMVLVNFNTLISLVDEVGGVEIDVKRTMKYKETNLDLQPGLQVLKGEDALGYARFREDDRGTRYFATDFERGQHQQEVVKALADQILSWTHVPKALKLLTIVSDNVQTDMSYTDMFSMVRQYYDAFHSDSFVSLTFPEYYSTDGDVIIPEEALTQLQNELNQHGISYHKNK